MHADHIELMLFAYRRFDRVIERVRPIANLHLLEAWRHPNDQTVGRFSEAILFEVKRRLHRRQAWVARRAEALDERREGTELVGHLDHIVAGDPLAIALFLLRSLSCLRADFEVEHLTGDRRYQECC